MRRLLARGDRDLLAQLAWSKVLLAFDFDGTLAPIVADRDAAIMRPRTARLFARVCDLYPCAVISGRGRADLTARLAGARVKYIVGNHGLEQGPGLRAFERDVAIARAALEAPLDRYSGVDIEDKRYSLAVHYRRSRGRWAARAAIARAVGALRVPMRIVPGKLVVNVVPALAPDKGDALIGLRARERADTALYVGDDVTDEDVFRLDQPGRLVTVRVGRSQTSVARYCLADQRGIDPLLARLAGLRAERTQ